MKNWIVLTFIFLAFFLYKKGNNILPLDEKSTLSKEAVAHTFNRLKGKLIQEKGPNIEDQIKVWESQNRHLCDQIISEYSSSLKEGNDGKDGKVQKVEGALNRLGLITEELKKTKPQLGESVELLTAVENGHLPCAANPDTLVAMGRGYGKQQKDPFKALLQLTKLNYHHFSKLPSFKGIGMGLEILKVGLDEKTLKPKDREKLLNLISQSRELTKEYQEELSSYKMAKVHYEKLDSISNHYDNERFLLQTRVRLYLQDVAKRYPIYHSATF